MIERWLNNPDEWIEDGLASLLSGSIIACHIVESPVENYEGIPSTTDNNANKDVQESANKDDGQERDNTNTNTKMFKHITAITCVIKPLVDCFLNNLSPVIYLNAFINRSAVK